MGEFIEVDRLESTRYRPGMEMVPRAQGRRPRRYGEEDEGNGSVRTLTERDNE